MLAALAALLSGASARPLPTRILAFGDSLTAGLVGGSTNRYSPYGDALARSLMDASGHEAEVYSRGVVMESVHAMPARLTKTLQAEGGGFDCALVLMPSLCVQQAQLVGHAEPDLACSLASPASR